MRRLAVLQPFVLLNLIRLFSSSPDNASRMLEPSQTRSARVVGPAEVQVIHEEHRLLVVDESLDLQTTQAAE